MFDIDLTDQAVLRLGPQQVPMVGVVEAAVGEVPAGQDAADANEGDPVILAAFTWALMSPKVPRMTRLSGQPTR